MRVGSPWRRRLRYWPARARWFDELAPALAAFQRALDAFGRAGQVTTFTLSDGNRTFRIDANTGTDDA